MPKVSVIIPAYNAEQFIKQTIDSVLSQTFRDFEIIVIDDGSKDKTAQIAESYGAPVRCLRQANGGVSKARNTGINSSTGEYIAFLDADDLWKPTKLEKQVALLDTEPHVGFCFTGIERVDENLKFVDRIDARAFDDYCAALLLYSTIATCSTAILRRTIARQVEGFDPSFTNYEDWEYWLRLSLITKFAPLPEHLVKYRIRAGSASFNNPAILEKNVIGGLDKFFNTPHLPGEYRKLRNRSYSKNWIVLSGEYLHAKQYADSLRCLLNGVRLSPQSVFYPLGLPVRWTRRLFANS